MLHIITDDKTGILASHSSTPISAYAVLKGLHQEQSLNPLSKSLSVVVIVYGHKCVTDIADKCQHPLSNA